MRNFWVALAGTFAVAAFAPGAYAFHNGGVARCESCHTMHNSSGGKVMNKKFPLYQAGPYLLIATDQSSTCLSCHESANSGATGAETYAVSTPAGTAIPAQYGAGGDFAWLRITWPGFSELGERHGHNIVAADFSYLPDATLTVAPGGTYPAAALGCQSCHDPHGKYRRLADGTFATSGAPITDSGSYGDSPDPTATEAVGAYRLLAGKGYQPKSLAGNFGFNVDPPVVVNGVEDELSWNRPENTTYGQQHVVYGQGMSEFCANCHTQILEESYTSGMKGLRHPAGNNAKLTGPIANIYNDYVTSGIVANLTYNYSSLVPFEQGTNNYGYLKATATANFVGGTTGQFTAPLQVTADATKNVMCLSCHRAHASAFPSMTRFYIGYQFMTITNPTTQALIFTGPHSGRDATYVDLWASQPQAQAAYYGRTPDQFANWARVQCNKCHGKD